MTVLASVDVEVTAKLNPIEAALAKNKTEIFAHEKAATKSLNKVAEEANKAGAAVVKAATGQSQAMAVVVPSMEKAAVAARIAAVEETRLALETNRAAKEAEKQAAALKRQAESAEKAATKERQLAAETAKAAEAAKAAAGEADKLAKANDNIAQGGKNAGAGLDVSAASANKLGNNLQRFVGQLTSGKPSLEALASSASGTAISLFEMGAAVAAVGIGVGVVAGVVVGGAMAWNKYEEAANSAALAVRGAGAAAGLTQSDFLAIAETAAAAANVSVNAAREMETAFVQAGIGNEKMLVDLTIATNDYAKMTGQTAVDAAKELAEAMKDPTAGAEMLEARFGSLDQKAIELIKTFQRQNNLTAAQTQLLRLLQGETAEAANQVTGLAGAYRNLATWAANAWHAMGKALALEAGGGATGERIKFLQERRNSPIGRVAGAVAGAFGSETPADTEIRRLQGIQATERATAQATRAQKERNEADAQGRAAVAALLPWDNQRVEIEGRMATVRRQLTAGTISQTQANRALAAGQVQLNQLNAKSDRNGAGRGRTARTPSNARAQQLARDAESMKVNAEASIELAEAYLKSADAGEIAEARRTALTAATKKGIDVEAQAARQLAVNIGNAAAGAAKNVAAQREEIAARRAANDSVVEGSQSVREATEWLEEDRASRLLQNLALHAEGEARETLLKIIEAQANAVRDLNKEEARAKIIAAAENQEEANDALRNELALIGQTNSARRTAIAQFETLARLKREGIDPASPEGSRLLKATNDNSAVQTQKDLATFMDGVTRSANAQMTALRQDAEAIGMTTEQATRFRYINEILADAQAKGIELTDAQRDAVERLGDAYTQASEKVRMMKEHQTALREATSYATDQFATFFDDVIFGSGKASDALRNLVRSAGQNMLKGFLSGEGPLAGILGTKGQNGNQGGGLGAMFGSMFGKLFKAPVAHSGMAAGTKAGASSRMVSPSLFMNAPRLHDGLKAGEFPAILEHGEKVTPKNQARRSEGNVVYMTVQAQDADSFRRSDRQIGRQLKRRLSI